VGWWNFLVAQSKTQTSPNIVTSLVPPMMYTRPPMTVAVWYDLGEKGDLSHMQLQEFRRVSKHQTSVRKSAEGEREFPRRPPKT
jgi:hypothetical protein